MKNNCRTGATDKKDCNIEVTNSSKFIFDKNLRKFTLSQIYSFSLFLLVFVGFSVLVIWGVSHPEMTSTFFKKLGV